MKKEKGQKRGDSLTDNLGRCKHCGQLIDHNSTFCKHCGGKHLSLISSKTKKCPKCKVIVEEIATYCKHCGVHFDHFIKNKVVKSLFHIIFLLIIILLIIVSFNLLEFKDKTPKSQDPGLDINILEPERSLTISGLSCVWERNSYKVCGTINWFGDESDYLKAFIPGSEEKEGSQPFFDNTIVYCQNIGNEDGYRVVRAVIYDKNNQIAEDIGEGVECKGKPSQEIGEFSFTKHFYFRAENDRGRPRGEGIFEVELENNPVSCLIDGVWKTDNNQILESRRYCDRASGSFTGYADKYNQYVENDANSFRWAGPSQSEFNPIIEKSDGYIINMYTCDNQYYRTDGRGRRYYVRGRVIDFSKNMKIQWEYFNDDTHPAVDIIFDFSCKGKA